MTREEIEERIDELRLKWDLREDEIWDEKREEGEDGTPTKRYYELLAEQDILERELEMLEMLEKQLDELGY